MPKIHLVDTTPLIALNRLEQHLGGKHTILLKRDDIGGVGGGGNKLRKLEYSVAEALAQGCDTLITFGALQSNHARLTAAVAAHCGLDCVLILSKRVARQDTFYTESGNVLLNDLLGAEIHVLEDDEDPLARADEIKDALVQQGRKPYVIPFGGSDALGALGYADCAQEIARQAEGKGIRVDHIVHASGSGGTQAGLIAGCERSLTGARVHGISVLAQAPALQETVHTIANGARERLGLPLGETATDVIVEDGFIDGGYGVVNEQTLDAVRLLAETEGILLDPVYTGKAFAGLLHLLRTEEIPQGDTVVFLHTGGMPGIFAYTSAFKAA